MKTTIFYFSGTGNSLFVAKETAKYIGSVELVNIADRVREDTIQVDGDKIGFVFPLYFYGIPRIVEKFIQKIDAPGVRYIFTIITAMFPNGIVLSQMKGLLERQKMKLDSGFYIQMPNSFIITRKRYSEKKEQKIMKAAGGRVKKIGEMIKNNLSHVDKESRIYNLLMGSFEKYDTWYNQVYGLDKNFTVDRCWGCGLCGKKCPVQNISFKDKKPQWNHGCEQCLRCLHICPAGAIEYGDATVGKKRYSIQFQGGVK